MNEWQEIQEGLYLEPNSFVVGDETFYNSYLHAKEGYHFYDVTTVVEDEDIIYSTEAVTPITDIDELNSIYKSEAILNV